eukprot:m.26979 g.26979  ORF g.26979 m.26979 type:complete len:208 (-) comp11737_c0_seq1:146-769(-)
MPPSHKISSHEYKFNGHDDKRPNRAPDNTGAMGHAKRTFQRENRNHKDLVVDAITHLHEPLFGTVGDHLGDFFLWFLIRAHPVVWAYYVLVGKSTKPLARCRHTYPVLRLRNKRTGRLAGYFRLDYGGSGWHSKAGGSKELYLSGMYSQSCSYPPFRSVSDLSSDDVFAKLSSGWNFGADYSVFNHNCKHWTSFVYQRLAGGSPKIV